MLTTSGLILLTWAVSIAYFDARFRRIPNLLTLGAWLVAVGLLLINHVSLWGSEASSAVLAAGFGLLMTLPAYLIHRLGAGDVKYIVAIGLLTSWPVTARCFVIAAVAGGLIAVVWLSVPRLLPLLPATLLDMNSSIGAWATTPVAKRRMAYGTLFSFGLMGSLWMDRHV